MAIKIISKNKKAFHDYQIGDSFEAGISLQGTEVKSLRGSKVNLSAGWVDVTRELQAWLNEVHIGHYEQGNRANHEETRPRRLLLHKHEMKKLSKAVEEEGYSIVPLKIYFKNGYVKVEIALGKGKKLHDKRQSSKEKDAKRDINRALKR